MLTADVQQNYPGEWGSEDERITDAVTKLSALAAQGVRTIVDPTVVGLGRNLPRIQRVAEQVPGLNIIVATGLYTYDSVPFFFYHRGPALNEALGTEVPDPMAAMFVGDITEGITGTGVRAGMLKCAIDEHGMTPGVERVMRGWPRRRKLGGPMLRLTLCDRSSAWRTRAFPPLSSACRVGGGVSSRAQIRAVCAHAAVSARRPAGYARQ